MRIVSFCAAVAVVWFCGFRCPAADDVPRVVILKLDDVTAQGAIGDRPVSERWQRVAHFCKEKDIKASFGIIGFSLEGDNPAYFEWIKALHRSGRIEFWNHGYRNRKASDEKGEFEGPYEQQKAALLKTQKLAKEKLGIELKAFGPHWSSTTRDTARALSEIPDITMWFYGPNDSDKFVFERIITLENPIFVPDFERFKERYERIGDDKKCLAMQGHPNAWDERRWAGFVKIVEFLQARGCVFMTPSEYLKCHKDDTGR